MNVLKFILYYLWLDLRRGLTNKRFWSTLGILAFVFSLFIGLRGIWPLTTYYYGGDAGYRAYVGRMFTQKIIIVGIVIFLLVAALFLYYDFDGGFLRYFDGSAPLLNARVTIDLIKWTIVPFFTFRSMTDNFTDWIQYGIFMGLALCLITGAGIWCYYQKGDLGDADQDE